MPFYECHIAATLESCEKRDVKGLYKKASQGQIPNFTGVGQDYERPTNPEITINGQKDIQVITEQILRFILWIGFSSH